MIETWRSNRSVAGMEPSIPTTRMTAIATQEFKDFSPDGTSSHMCQCPLGTN